MSNFFLYVAAVLAFFLVLTVDASGQCPPGGCEVCPSRVVIPAPMPTLAIPRPHVVDIVPGDVIEVPVEVWVRPAPVVARRVPRWVPVRRGLFFPRVRWVRRF